MNLEENRKVKNNPVNPDALLAAKQKTKERDYWLDKLSGDLEKSFFPTGHPRDKDNKRSIKTFNFPFSPQCISGLNNVAGGSDLKLHIVLASALTVLLHKYTGNNDITIGTPIYKQEAEGNYINTFLALRNDVKENMTFKELLSAMKKTIVEAVEHRNYPLEILAQQFNESYSAGDDFPFFDVALVLENIQHRKSIEHIHTNMIFTFRGSGKDFGCVLDYNEEIYKEEIVQRILHHLQRLLIQVLPGLDTKLPQIDILSSREKKRILEDFNDTALNYPAQSTIHKLFEEQVEEMPGHIAVVDTGSNRFLTYSELNRRANQLARYLLLKGIKTEDAVGIMTEASMETILGVLAILKAGGAYLPINPNYPEKRKKYLLADGQVRVLLTNRNHRQELPGDLDIIQLDDVSSFRQLETANLETAGAGNLAYIIFTSGSTGKPKGVLVEHRGVVRLVKNTDYVEYRRHDRLLQTGALEFDASTFEIWGSLLNGMVLFTAPKETVLTALKLKQTLALHHIGTMFMTPALFSKMADTDVDIFQYPHSLMVGGDVLSPLHVARVKEKFPRINIINLYGPTENTSISTSYTVEQEGGDTIPIGKPIANSTAYILDRYNHPVPIGGEGELVVGGDGVARGYLNNPELTNEKFACLPFTETRQQKPGNRIYHTGDLARWMPDGNILFRGRIDLQVKIRGFRIELEGIKNRLLEYKEIHDAVVIAREDQQGEKNIFAYLVSEKDIDVSELKHFLAKDLPNFMIPAYLVPIEKIPLTINGKVDRGALPIPRAQDAPKVRYVAPRDVIEQRLAEIWTEILPGNPASISIMANFFELGGHSLLATVMISLIHKALDVQVPLGEVFKFPTIGELAEFIRGSSRDTYVSIEPAEKKEYYPLSSAQTRLYVLQQLEPDGTAYNIPHMIPLAEAPDIDRFRETVLHLIRRHESFRTSFIMMNDEPVQVIHDQVPFEIENYDHANTGDFVRPFDLSRAPLLRVGLLKAGQAGETGRAGRTGYALLVDMHHIISDGVSHQILSNDFMRLFENREPAPLRIQYKDFSEWQNAGQQQRNRRKQEQWWINRFSDEIPVLNLPVDYQRPMLQSFEGDNVDVRLSTETTSALKSAALAQGATLFMILSALVNILLAKLSGQEDIVVGTPVAGRRHADLDKVIGMFVNTLALRNFPAGEKAFNRFLQEVKTNTLQAFENQDCQFEDLVEAVAVNRDTSRNPLFDVMFTLNTIRDEQSSPKQDSKDYVEDSGDELGDDFGDEPGDNTAKFDLTVTGFEVRDQLSFSFQYCSKLFKKETILRFIRYFNNIISAVLADPEAKLFEIAVMTPEERQQLLYEFNDRNSEYEKGFPVHTMFQRQAHKDPTKIAVSDGALELSYAGLNEKSNQLARVLMAKGVTANTVVGIMVPRSVHMVTAILGILKSGGAYLPIDPAYPPARKQQMLADSAAPLVITGITGENGGERIMDCQPVDITDPELYNGDGTDLQLTYSPQDLIYTIFTSGSTGRPKGAGVYHAGFANLMHWYIKEFNLNANDSTLLLTSLSFDLTQKNIYAPLCVGGTLHIPTSPYFDPAEVIQAVSGSKLTWLNCTPSMFYRLVEDSEELPKLSSLRYVFLGGEPIAMAMLSNWFTSPHCSGRIVNTYGPTECTDVCVYYPLTEPEKLNRNHVPTGKPVYNTQLYILDRHLRLAPPGVAGEICIGGDGLGPGYINRPEMTTEKFVPISLDDHREELIYRTGDLGRWLPDGNIDFLGRMDFQVKIRGFRIELGEIENQLLKRDDIKEAVVIDRPAATEGGDRYLCAYVVPEGDSTLDENTPGKTPDAEVLKEYLSGILPDYMVPAYFVGLDAIPLNPNGKVDRKALPQPELKETRKTAYTAPRDRVEEELVEIWSRILGGAPGSIGIEDHFFRLGGHSLSATVMVSHIHKFLDVKVPLAEVFKTPTIRGLAEYIRGSARDTFSSIEPVEKKEYYSLSSAQKRLYILQQLEPGGTAYNMPEAIPLNEAPDNDKFQQTLLKMIRRHESFRTSFHMLDDEPVQVIHEDVPFRIEFLSLREGGGTGDFVKPFDLSRAPLLRVGLMDTGQNRHLLLVDMHHIISDGISHLVLRDDFMRLFADRELPPLRIQYKDFSQWQNAAQQQQSRRNQEQWWINRFNDEVPVLNLPADFQRPMLQSFEGDNVDVRLSPEITNALKHAALAQGATLFMILSALVNILLAKLSGQEDIVLGTPVAGRRHADLEKIIGMFVNTLALRNFPAGEKAFNHFLQEVKTNTLQAFENQDCQFEDLVEMVAVNRDTSRNPLFDVMFTLNTLEEEPGAPEQDNGQSGEEVGEELGEELGDEPGDSTAKFDLTVTGFEVGDELSFSFQYCSKLFKKETIRRFIRYFNNIICAVLADPEAKLFEITVLTPEEREQLLYEFNDNAREYEKDIPVHLLFQQQAHKDPSKIAVSDGALELSYAGLNEKSNRLARVLTAKGVTANTVVGIMVPRSVHMVTAILGILKSGGAYLPIDPAYPPARKQQMLADSAAPLVITGITGENGGEGIKDCQPIDITDPELYNGDGTDLQLTYSPQDLIYTIFTSGSTGRPKGAGVYHAGFANLMNWYIKEFNLNANDSTLLLTSLSFDLTQKNIYAPLCVGGTLHIPTSPYFDPAEVIQAVSGSKLTWLNCTPSMFYRMVEDKEELPKLSSLRYAFLGGEPIAMAMLSNWFDNPHCSGQIVNTYGPTECTDVCVYYPLTEPEKLNRNHVPTGIPVYNTQLYILDRHLLPVPPVVPGEICIGGDGLGPGYINRPAMTKEKFVPISLDDHREELIYRTGDLGRWLPDGNIDFLGRMDFQVKIRGFRIELGEIENQMLKRVDIKEAVVIDRPAVAESREGGDVYLCAYVVPESGGTPDTEVLKEYLSGILPDYMVPAYFVGLDTIPLNPNGKVDRKALPQPELKDSSGTEYIAPRNAIEEQLLDIWQEVLFGNDTPPVQIGINDNFFQLGGHSLKATVMTGGIRKKLNVQLPLTEIFKTPTIQGLADYIKNINSIPEQAHALADEALVLLRNTGDSAANLFFLHDGTGEVDGYVEFCGLLEGEFNHWGLRMERPKSIAPQNIDAQQLAGDYIDKIKTRQPHGPFFIIGWSLGGTIAFEMARQLESENEEIALLALIDSPPPHKDLWNTAVTFNSQSELEFIKTYPIGDDLEKSLNQATGIDEFWLSIVRYLESNNVGVQAVNRVIAHYGMPLLPTGLNPNIADAVSYLNVVRTLNNARARYKPNRKIKAPVHYVAASQSRTTIKGSWNEYCLNPITSYEIDAEHYSIFKEPAVADIARLFSNIINNQKK